MKSSISWSGRLTFALIVTLDGCCDHREMIVDDEGLDHFYRSDEIPRGQDPKRRLLSASRARAQVNAGA